MNISATSKPRWHQWSETEKALLQVYIARKSSLAQVTAALPGRAQSAIAAYASKYYGFHRWYEQVIREKMLALRPPKSEAAAAVISAADYRVEFKVIATYAHPDGERRELTFCHDRAEYDAACREARIERTYPLTGLIVESVGRGVGDPYVMERVQCSA